MAALWREVVRPLVAGSVSYRASLTAALGEPGPCIESQLLGAVAYSHCRPVAVIPSPRKSPLQRLVSKYSRPRSTAAPRCSFSKAVAHGLAPLIGIHRRGYVRSSVRRTGTADPLQSVHLANGPPESSLMSELRGSDMRRPYLGSSDPEASRNKWRSQGCV
jgi:hypothetical protein